MSGLVSGLTTSDLATRTYVDQTVASSVDAAAGDGLTESNDVLNVGGGTGITANADDVQITDSGVGTTQLDLSIAPTWTGQHVFEETLTVRQPGGTAGTDEVQMYHDGTDTLYNVKGPQNAGYRFYTQDKSPDGKDHYLSIFEIGSNGVGIEANALDRYLGGSGNGWTKTYLDGPIYDNDGNELLSFTSNSSAVNHLDVANAASGNAPTLSAVGGDADVDISLTPKGVGNVNITDGRALELFDGGNRDGRLTNVGGDIHLRSDPSNSLEFYPAGDRAVKLTTNQNVLIGKASHAADLAEIAGTVRAEGGLRLPSTREIIDSNGNQYLTFTENSSAVNHLQVANASSGSAPTLSAVGGDSNIRLRFEYKGNGSFDFVSPGDLSPAFKAINSNGNTVIRFGGTSDKAFIDSFGTSSLVLRTSKSIEAARYTSNQEWLLGKTTHVADLAEVAGTVRAEGGTRSASPTIADDSVATVTPDRNRVKVHVYDGSGESGEATLDVSSGTLVNTNYSTANFDFTTGDLSGTTGTDGNITVSADGTNNTIDVENRTGSSKTVTVAIIG